MRKPIGDPSGLSSSPSFLTRINWSNWTICGFAWRKKLGSFSVSEDSVWSVFSGS